MKHGFLSALLFLTTAVASQAQSVFPTNGSNVGIGTTTPQARLEIMPVANSGASAIVHMNGAEAWGHILTLASDNSTGDDPRLLFSYRNKSKHWALGGYTNTSRFGIWEDSGDGVYGSGWGTERFTMLPGGNIGIGTAAPNAKLDVNGSIYSNAESHFFVNSYTDPVPGTTYAVKVGSNGIAVNGNSAFLNGNVLIGKTSQSNTSYKLDVAGSIRANQITVNTTGADFVFSHSYKLRPLFSVQNYINKNHHLPEIASAKEMSEEGMEVGEMNKKLLQKVEELTLYLIQKDKELKNQQQEISELKIKVEKISKSIIK